MRGALHTGQRKMEAEEVSVWYLQEEARLKPPSSKETYEKK